MPYLQGCMPCIFVIFVATSTSMQSSLLNDADFRDSEFHQVLALSLFLCHMFMLFPSDPLQRILQNPEATGRIVEWALELSNFGLKFESTSTIQSRALAEFIAEWTPTLDEEVTETVIPIAVSCSSSGGQIWSPFGALEREIFDVRHHQPFSIANYMMLPTGSE